MRAIYCSLIWFLRASRSLPSKNESSIKVGGVECSSDLEVPAPRSKSVRQVSHHIGCEGIEELEALSAHKRDGLAGN